jgi:outer membrane receptor protein involved in Fe transport
VDGSNVLVAASYSNFGDVNTQGLDLGFSVVLAPGWEASFNYSWLDFTIEDELPGFSSLLLPNAPENAIGAGVTYDDGPVGVRVGVRWVDDFRWGVGPFQGPVETYTVVNHYAQYRFTRRVSIGVDVANLLNDEHWEAFGGDLVGRRALANLRYGW